MAWDFKTVTHPVARKEYNCDAWEWINWAGDAPEYTEEDRKILEQAVQEGNKITKGSTYVKVTGKWEGEFCTFRARLDLHTLCVEFNIYPED